MQCKKPLGKKPQDKFSFRHHNKRNVAIQIIQSLKGMEYFLCIFVNLSLTLEILDLQICSGWVTVLWKSWCRSVFLLRLVPTNFLWLLLNVKFVKTAGTNTDSSLFLPPGMSSHWHFYPPLISLFFIPSIVPLPSQQVWRFPFLGFFPEQACWE